jgi:hypothetical protein
MKKTFVYDRIIRSHYLSGTDEYEYETEEFHHTVYEDDLLDAVIDIIYEQHFYDSDNELCWNVDFVTTVKQGIKKFIEDNDNLSELVDHYEDDLKDYFEESAKEYYE